MDLSDHWRAMPVPDECVYNDRHIAAHSEKFDDRFTLFCAACGESHDFELVEE